MKKSNKNNNKNPILFDKHSNVFSNPIFIVYLILKQYVSSPKRLKNDRKVSVYTLFNDIKKINSKIPSKQIYLSILLMYSLGLTEFQRPYLIIKKP
jgi:hypothetical protein